MLTGTFIIFLCLFSPPQNPRYGSLSGIVRDFTTKEPLSGVAVVQPGTHRRTISDAQGRFRLDKLTPGFIRLEFNAEGYPTTSWNVEILADSTTELPVTLPKFPQKTGRMPVYVPDSTVEYKMRYIDPTKPLQDTGKGTVKKKEKGKKGD